MARSAGPLVNGKQYAYTVHAVWLAAGPQGIDQGAIELIELNLIKANEYARQRSLGTGVKVAIVTRLEIGELGTRHLVGWWVDGRQYGMGTPRLDRPGAELPMFLPEHPLPTS